MLDKRHHEQCELKPHQEQETYVITNTVVPCSFSLKERRWWWKEEVDNDDIIEKQRNLAMCYFELNGV